MPDIELSVSQFVDLLNQTLEYAYPVVTVVGELANFRVSKNRWIYFDLKDEEAVVRCFGTVYMLPGPLEDGMLVKVKAQPRLHVQYGFSLNVMQIVPSGEGAIKRAASLLETKLTAEGLFDPTRKRSLPYPPHRIGLIASTESAAYTDFIKVLDGRFGGLEISVVNVQVQGEVAAEQIVRAIERLNQMPQPPEVLVITRGGGSAEDMQAFSSEPVTRAVAASRIPTLVAIGHERDISLAELAADRRASTPSNAAELLVPDRTHLLQNLALVRNQLASTTRQSLTSAQTYLENQSADLKLALKQLFDGVSDKLSNRKQLLELLNPEAALKRGYAIIRSQKHVIRSIKQLKTNQLLTLKLIDGLADAQVTSVKQK